MASTTDVSLVIAGIGHVYYGAPDTPVPANGLFDYAFGDGTTLEKDSWTWMGDTSSENKMELSTDGGDSTTKRTWDRVNVRETKAAKTTTLSLNSVSISNDTIQVAFPGATYDPDLQMWSLPDDGAAERAILVVVVDGLRVSGYYFPRVNLSGDFPTVDTENFSEIKISGTILAPASGKSSRNILRARAVTGVSQAKPTVTKVEPATAKPLATVTLTGTNFDGVRLVTLGDVECPFEKISATTLKIQVPGKGKTGSIVVTNGKGKSDGISFTVA